MEQKTNINEIKPTTISPSLESIKILKNIINILPQSKPNQYNYISDIEWIIKNIENFSLYSLQLLHPDKINALNKDNQNYLNLIQQVEAYNKDISDIKTKYDTLISDSIKQYSALELLQNNNESQNKSLNKKINLSQKISQKNTKIKKNQNQLLFQNNNITTNYISNINKTDYTRNIKNQKKSNKINLFNPILLSTFTIYTKKCINSSNKKSDNSKSFNNILKQVVDNKLRPNSYSKYIKRNNTSNNEINKHPFIHCINLLNIKKYDINQILTKDFNLFELEQIIGFDNVLPIMGKTILERFNINEKLLKTNKLESFLTSVSKSYFKSTLYHNSLHGSDVTHTISMIFINSNAQSILDFKLLDIMSIIVGYIIY